ncbi:DUF3817 domain-containing protein [Umezawaea tangerina]|uniref:Uncharacterized protein n=1 Tax=Umezawaea tangerina TaxID=84725 RepID=A0A2T0THR8_9PSEU|nr:DUF3817 domain-containing protein [Umezawaea tangerina]PRY45247.1 hypothetical protein CLV43_102812 [Umezawaea tangerina]
MTSSRQALRIAAAVELVSLVLLLTNLFTVHWRGVSSLLGPTHGCAYLFVVVLAFRWDAATTRTRLLSLVPGVGGLLVLRQPAAAPPRGVRGG